MNFLYIWRHRWTCGVLPLYECRLCNIIFFLFSLLHSVRCVRGVARLFPCTQLTRQNFMTPARTYTIRFRLLYSLRLFLQMALLNQCLISFNSNNLRNTTKKLDIKFYKNLKYQKNFFMQLIKKQWHLICTVIHIVSLTSTIDKTCQMQYRICYLLKVFINYCVRKASAHMYYNHCLKIDICWCRSICLILGITLVTWTFGAILGWCYLHSSSLWPEKTFFYCQWKRKYFLKYCKQYFLTTEI